MVCWLEVACDRLHALLSWAVKEEHRDEDEEAKTKAPLRAARKTPGLPKDVSVAELLRELSLTQEGELLFLQLPDSLPGQPPTQDIKPIKTEVQSEDGQMVLVKQERDRVRSPVRAAKRRGTWGEQRDVARQGHGALCFGPDCMCVYFSQGTV